ncbi:MAG: hypothetical protein H5T71_00205 [Chloroflexi bacterium]|nr:hypothetical protein [Chloroflexota bacterium]MBC7255441.1 hypothetical protein [Chloroflexota bacterium]
MKKRIQVYTDPETKRRIELAAAKHELAVTDYCLQAIKQYLVEDDVLERESIEIPIRPTRGVDFLTELRKLREAILADRGGKPIDVDIAAFIDQMRQERNEELTGVR